MYNKLIFDETEFTVETVEEEGKTLVYRAFENIPYVTKPADEKIQRLSIFVPELYYEGKSIDGYNLKNAPIFMPNTVGGYMPGPQERPGKDFMQHFLLCCMDMLLFHREYVDVKCRIKRDVISAQRRPCCVI